MELQSYLRTVITPEWAAAFYARFFELRPDARNLFTGSPAAQAEKFSATLFVLIQELESPNLGAELRDLGHRHVSYRVTESLYEDALRALLETLRATNPAEWHPAWDAQVTTLYRTIIAKMHPSLGENPTDADPR
jgi:hemoglobin-like flavoprotein